MDARIHPCPDGLAVLLNHKGHGWVIASHKRLQSLFYALNSDKLCQWKGPNLQWSDISEIPHLQSTLYPCLHTILMTGIGTVGNRITMARCVFLNVPGNSRSTARSFQPFLIKSDFIDDPSPINLRLPPLTWTLVRLGINLGLRPQNFTADIYVSLLTLSRITIFSYSIPIHFVCLYIYITMHPFINAHQCCGFMVIVCIHILDMSHENYLIMASGIQWTV